MAAPVSAKWEGKMMLGSGHALQNLGNTHLNTIILFLKGSEMSNLFYDHFRRQYLTKKRKLIQALTPTFNI